MHFIFGDIYPNSVKKLLKITTLIDGKNTTTAGAYDASQRIRTDTGKAPNWGI